LQRLVESQCSRVGGVSRREGEVTGPNQPLQLTAAALAIILDSTCTCRRGR
jgi:hypothetical protein